MKKSEMLDPSILADIKSKSIRGLSLLVIREVAIKVIAICGQLLLVRLLAPEVFGVIAIVTFLINIGDLFSDLGLVSGVIRSKERPTHEMLSTFFVIKQTMSLFVVCLLLGGFPFFLRMLPALSGLDIRIYIIFCSTLLLRPLRTLLYGLLERELRYDIIPFVDIVGLLVYFGTAATLAFLHMGVWSLVLSVVVKDVVELILLEVASPFIPHPRFSWKYLSTFIKFGAPVQGNTILGILHQSTIPLFGGRFLVPANVGLLDWSFNIASLPRAITDNVGRIAFASFSRLQEDRVILARAIEETIGVGSLLIFFIFSLSVVSGRSAIEVIVGPLWMGAAPALSWLLLAEVFLFVAGVLQQAIIARGFTKELLTFSFIGLLIQWGSALLFLRFFGYVGIAMGICVGMGTLALFYSHVIQVAGIRFSLVKTIFPSMLITVLSLGMMTLIPTFHGLLAAIARGAFFGCVYFIFSLLLARSVISRLILLLRSYVFRGTIKKN